MHPLAADGCVTKSIVGGMRHNVQGATSALVTTNTLDYSDAVIVSFHTNLPGLGLHALGGNRKGTWAVKVSGNWRVTFKFVGQEIVSVDYEDYH